MAYPTSCAGPGEPNNGPDHTPSPEDVKAVYQIITEAIRSPPEVAIMILNWAEYWVRSDSECHFEHEHCDPLAIDADSDVRNKFLLRSFPVGFMRPKGTQNNIETLTYDTKMVESGTLNTDHDASYFATLAGHPVPGPPRPVREIVIGVRIKVRPNQMATQLDGDIAWFRLGIERLDASHNCERGCTYDYRTGEPPLPICGLRNVPNPHALSGIKIEHREWQNYEWVLSFNESEANKEVLREWKLGDVITIWADVKPGWLIKIETVRITLFWAMI